GHFVVVVGADDSSFYLNDPDFWGNKRNYGAGLKVTTDEFVAALKGSPIPNTAIFVSASAVAPATPATPLEHQAAPGPAHVNTDVINLRNGPAGGVTTTLKQFADVNIQEDAPVSATLGGTPYVWVKVQSGDGTYGWCVEQYLTTGYASAAQG
ncbi:MAG TPA: SH3 domain-containing protein, partial [Aggregatilineales bacterium]|nr:SH3 domain-containing protein [Aggregatilineales bacterium]